ncbi:Fic family protein [Kribbella sp. VKM Ac-2527]|uniref:Fic family protein n=1 Tax=Kribbella caucasensis TaxID=2512215 RepID=A0A4R6KBE3_9ACTN|nr:Fic family protein [Kribbella sp. VKM Ac-2527]TDO44921.1 Fic family protein [Kribbella sp. VKM Ac-2527]
MRSFADLDRLIGQVPASVVIRLRDIDTGRGSEGLYRHQLPALLTELAGRARVQSITASSAIEGVVVPDIRRAQQIIDGSAGKLRDRSEQELAGYRKALDYLFQEHWRPLNIGLILHLHRLLWSETTLKGGDLKIDDNIVVDRSPDSTVTVRFVPVPAAKTESYLVDLLDRYEAAQQAGAHHPILLVGLAVLDLLVIHPFADGNGRVARALTNALLLDAGYEVCRWVSLEQSIADTADEYYETLLRSTHDWHQDEADPWPWLGYFVGILASAYETFARKAAADRSGTTKQERVRTYVLRHAAPVFQLSEVRAALPGVSDQTIRLVLDQLKNEQRLMPEGTGRAARWRRIPLPRV